MQSHHSLRPPLVTRRSALAALATAGVLVVAGCSSTAQSGTTPEPSSPAPSGSAVSAATISAQGLGRATGVPDTVTLQIGVQTTNASANTAIKDNATKSDQLIATFKAAGVADKDMQTSQLSVNPNYNSTGKPDGYQVTNMLSIKVVGVDKAGPLIDQAGKAAGDSIRLYGLSFGFSDDSAVMAQARTDAVRQARTQATQLAEAAGVKLGAVKSIVEQPSGYSGPASYAASASDAAGSMPIQPGSIDLAVTVQVVYQITS